MQEKNSISWESKTSEASVWTFFREQSETVNTFKDLAKWVENSTKKYSSLKVIGSGTAYSAVTLWPWDLFQDWTIANETTVIRSAETVIRIIEIMLQLPNIDHSAPKGGITKWNR